MNRRLILTLAVAWLLLAASTLSGCLVSTTGHITGTVTLGRGGPGAAGVTVTAAGAVTTTDAYGRFDLKVRAGTVDVIATKPGSGAQQGLAASRLQNITVARGRTTKVEMIVQPQQVPGASAPPPTVGTSLIPGRRYAGAGTFTVFFTSSLPAYRLDIRYGHRDLLPDQTFELSSPTAAPIAVQWDTSQVPRDSVGDYGLLAGETYVLLTLYDTNYNSTELVIPILLSNSAEAPLTEAVQDLSAVATTLGANLMLMSIGGTGASPNSTLFVQLDWTETAEWRNIQNYRVYRSFTSRTGPWERIAEVPANASFGSHEYWDASSQLGVDRPVWYYVAPHNSHGEGPASRVVMTQPLPRFWVELVSPQNGLFGVDSSSLTFTWRLPNEYAPGGAHDGAAFSYRLNLSGWNDAADTWVWPGSGSTDFWTWPATLTSVAYVANGGTPLQSAKQYRWDITDAFAKEVYDRDGTGAVRGSAVAYSGWTGGTGDGFSDGSVNGPFSFTTSP